MEQTLQVPLGWDAEQPPFHAGELAVQARVGVQEPAETAGRRGIRRYMPDQHRQFFNEQPFMVLSGVDAQGQPWASVRVGAPGFVSSPDPQTLRIAGDALPGDPLANCLRLGAVVGALGIQPATRRRNRVNGVITHVDSAGLTLHVSQSFGNCPRYIQARVPTPVLRSAGHPGEPRVDRKLDAADRALLAKADTYFIASANTGSDAGLAAGADVSHRGGLPGFVRVDDECTLTSAEFNGNRFFNTLGNLTSDPRAGLLFIDFDGGDLLYIAARAEIIWEGSEIAQFVGAERLLRFHIEEVRHSRGALPFQWSEVDYAPQFARAPVVG